MDYCESLEEKNNCSRCSIKNVSELQVKRLSLYVRVKSVLSGKEFIAPFELLDKDKGVVGKDIR